MEIPSASVAREDTRHGFGTAPRISLLASFPNSILWVHGTSGHAPALVQTKITTNLFVRIANPTSRKSYCSLTPTDWRMRTCVKAKGNPSSGTFFLLLHFHFNSHRAARKVIGAGNAKKSTFAIGAYKLVIFIAVRKIFGRDAQIRIASIQAFRSEQRGNI